MIVTLGLDVGSLFTKAVLLKDDAIAASMIRETTGHVAREVEELIAGVTAMGGVSQKDIAALVSTGQGDELVRQADFSEDDVACIAVAARRLLPGAEMAIDIGGQSITAVLSNPDGEVLNFMRNDKCASGSGRFIEVISGALGVAMDDVDETARRATKKISVSTQCAVFAESEIISHVNQGEAVPDIIAGVCESMARIVVSQALRFGPVKGFTITGGVARFRSVTGVLQERLNGQYYPFPLDPRLAAAYGAALIGQEEEQL